ncbi:Protein CBG21751 [Caenorhabditis briggsae]|uniref:Protein CBG21751 n=1 Tax=Caenorhabditis briggsae TaxID=6238 RepID=A8Y0K7_CAEBR|nr:Protein CBG21751 [Caenorhabditis briggsae]CAP38425.2 Protein CBG21751 [Caenorhabditis briggsae]
MDCNWIWSWNVQLNVIVFMVQNGQITTRTGRTTGYGPPVFDNQNNINVSMANHSGSTLNALFSVPWNVRNCQAMNFVQSGPINNGQMGVHTSRPDQVNNVCASQCRWHYT